MSNILSINQTLCEGMGGSIFDGGIKGQDIFSEVSPFQKLISSQLMQEVANPMGNSSSPKLLEESMPEDYFLEESCEFSEKTEDIEKENYEIPAEISMLLGMENSVTIKEDEKIVVLRPIAEEQETIPNNLQTEEVKQNATQSVSDSVKQGADQEQNTDVSKEDKLPNQTFEKAGLEAINTTIKDGNVETERQIYDSKIPKEMSNEISENVELDNKGQAKGIQKVDNTESKTANNFLDTTQVSGLDKGQAETVSQIQVSQSPEPYEQIGKEIQAKLEQKAPTEFKMQLQPKELGLIDVKLKINNGKLVINILAANEKTQALLAGQVDKLVQNMGLHNVQVENIQLNLQGTEEQSSSFMNSSMDFSQRKQQEHLQQDFRNSWNPVEPDDEQETNEIFKGLNNYRIDYKV